LAILAATASKRLAPKPRQPTLRGSSLFPKIGGWRLSDGPRDTRLNLFEYIDGGLSRFCNLTSRSSRGDLRQRRSSPRRESQVLGHSPATISVDIYRHRDAMRAFGCTPKSARRHTPLPIGIEAMAAGLSRIRVGSTYVKLVQSAADPAALRGSQKNWLRPARHPRARQS